MATVSHPDELTIYDKRAALNPFKQSPWQDTFEELTYGYMENEDRDWLPSGPHHERWLELFEEGSSVGILAHRSSLKTTCVLSYLAANLEYRDGLHAAWIGNNQTLAYKKAHNEFNKLVDRNPWLTELNQPRVEDSKSYKEFANGSSLQVGWLYGGIEGEHVDVLVVDDLIKEKGDGDPQEIVDWLDSVIVPIQEKGGQTIIIGTRKRSNGIYSELLSREGYEWREYPAVLNRWDEEYSDSETYSSRRPDPSLYTEMPDPLNPGETAQILWSERGTSYLDSQLQKQSEHAFVREFCLVVETKQGAVYPNFSVSRHVVEGMPDDKVLDHWLYGLDWGSGNPAGILAVARFEDGDWYAAAEHKEPADGTSDYVHVLERYGGDYGYGRVGCDPSDKRGVNDLHDEGIDAVAAPNDVEPGIRNVRGLFAEGGDTLYVDSRCTELVNELQHYRYKTTGDRPVKKNDHLVDALRYAVMTEKYMSGGGTSTSDYSLGDVF